MDSRDKQKDKQRPVKTGDKVIIGTPTEKDTSEAYLSEDETGQADFAEQGQGATESRAGNEDIESGVSTTRDAALDDGS